MFNSIIFDKSAFESLNIAEIFFLHQYYFPIVSHILIIEILADLKKEDDGRDKQERVQQLSHKILQLNPKYTLHYRELIERELRGEYIEMSRRPVVGQGRNVISENGQKGVVIKQQVEEEILQRWQDRQFDEAEKLSAVQWRQSIAENTIDLEDLDRSEGIQALKNLDDIVAYVDQYLALPESQNNILEHVLSLYRIDPTNASQIFYKFETNQFSLLCMIAPYSCFCYRIFLVFSLALVRGIITPRKTDIIDLQYLYYLPFSTIFTSNDKFHNMFAPLFLEKDQIFILGSDLKNDLRTIVAMRDVQKDGERYSWMLQHRRYPPEIESSFTSDLWKKHVPYSLRKSEDTEKTRTPEENKELVDRLNRLAKSPVNPDYTGPFKDDETDFVVIERKVSHEDFCPCGSGKLFKDCHLPEVKKNHNT